MEDVPYGRILREGWAIILLAAIVGAAIAYGITVPMQRTYAASSTLILQVESDQASLFERNQFSQARIKSYPPLVDSPEVVDGVRADLGLDPAEYSDRDIMKMLSAENTTDTVLLVVTAQAPTAKMSADMANSAAKHTSALIESTENTPGDSRYTVTMQQVLPATQPASPVSPQTLPIVGLGLILGLAVGAIVAVYRTTTNRHLHTISDVRKACGLPVVGRVPRRSRLSPNGKRSREVQSAAYAETVSNVVALAGADHRAIVVVPTSPHALEVQAVAGLVQAYAELGRRAQIVDLRAAARASASPPDADAPRAGRKGGTVPLADVLTRLDGYDAAADIAVAILDPGMTGTLAGLAAHGIPIVIGTRAGETTVTELIAVSMRMQVMGIRPLGVLMTGTRSGANDAVAESWTASDRYVTAAQGDAQSR
ncbi:YveK family protein [Microbacterium sp. NPDC057659]|uniref:YveK family protein n=1 Tax=Microbacterium sp. NPDC057659 TaxID=3346198 RepID=UPI00366D4C34